MVRIAKSSFSQKHLKLKNNTKYEISDSIVRKAFEDLNLIQFEKISKNIVLINNLNLNDLNAVKELYDQTINKVLENNARYNKKILKKVDTKNSKIMRIQKLLDEMHACFAETLGLLWTVDYILLNKLEKHILELKDDTLKEKYLELGKEYQNKINKIAPNLDSIARYQKSILNLLDPKEIFFKDSDFFTNNFILRIKQYLAELILGNCASPGISVGIVGKDILAGLNFSTKDDPLLIKSKAIIVEEGCVLSHPAIVAREYKIPCLVNAKDATKKLKLKDKVYVNASEGYCVKI